MSYPDARYHAAGGTINAVFRPATVGPAIETAAGGAVHYLATGRDTGGLFGLYRWDFGPGRSGPDPHFHRTLSESFYILDGTVGLYDGARWITASAGDFLHVPPGGVHAFTNDSGRPASMLLLFAPGAPREAYFETLADLGHHRRSPMTALERDRFMREHDTYWLDPPAH